MSQEQESPAISVLRLAVGVCQVRFNIEEAHLSNPDRFCNLDIAFKICEGLPPDKLLYFLKKHSGCQDLRIYKGTDGNFTVRAILRQGYQMFKVPLYGIIDAFSLEAIEEAQIKLRGMLLDILNTESSDLFELLVGESRSGM